ncbi:hypothetical protein HDZ31DRAFT_50503, partial [Schizophyllum fasciatum]
DARPVLSTACSSTHRTGEFAVPGLARDAFFDVPRPSRPRLRGGRGPCLHNGTDIHARACAPGVTRV